MCRGRETHSSWLNWVSIKCRAKFQTKTTTHTHTHTHRNTFLNTNCSWSALDTKTKHSVRATHSLSQTHINNHMHQAGINIHKHTRPFTQVNFLGIHVLLIVCCVNIYLNTLQSPRSLHLAHHFPHAPNVERAAITHTHCVYLILKIKIHC